MTIILHKWSVYRTCSSACENKVTFDGPEKGMFSIDAFLIGLHVLSDYLTNFF